jgi:CBS domain-containing protein
MKVKVAEVMHSNKQRPYHITPTATVQEAARLMEQHEISSLLVITDEDVLTGVITERDLRNFVARDESSSAHRVGEIMTPGNKIVKVQKTDDLEVALKLMKELRIRHVPVEHNGSIVGILSQRDVTDWSLSMVHDLNRLVSGAPN